MTIPLASGGFFDGFDLALSFLSDPASALLRAAPGALDLSADRVPGAFDA